ncbi:hypothetical protein, partial [Photobacterium gaetbulicola]|uniref:hypothetical protein n=1 Tax=Photobacterium gaetbulicola TaxID=1295392 RepID=UPI001E4444D8
MLEPFSYVQLAEQRIPPIPKQRVLGRSFRISGMPAQSPLPSSKPQQKCWGFFASVAYSKKHPQLRAC